MSKSVAEAFSLEENDALHETERFIRTFDHFFDCMNVRNFNEAIYRRKPDLRPYRSSDDARLSVSVNNIIIMYHVPLIIHVSL